MSRQSRFPVNITIAISTAMDQRLKAVCADELSPDYVSDFVRRAVKDALYKIPMSNGQLKEHV